MRRLCILMLLSLVLLPLEASAQTRIIKGRVLDGLDKQALVGANVTLPKTELSRLGLSTAVGVATDLEGNYRLQVPSGTRQIVVSYIGYKEEILTLKAGQEVYNVTLQPEAEQLDALVVTGYQAVERRKLTASIAKLDLKESVVGSAKSIDQALAGQIAGVSVTNVTGTPGAPARIRIRGTASLSGTQDPLWVLDGIPLEGTDIPKLDSSNDNDILNIGQSSIAGLSPSDIESITILKDAAATAIYGARAANGVIVITTKSGRSGKPSFQFSSRLSFSPRLSNKRLNLLNANEKVNLELELLREPLTLYGTNTFPLKGTVAELISQDPNVLSAYKTNGLSALPQSLLSSIDALRTTETNWNDILFRNALTQEYNLSISGGGDKVTYYNSLGFTEENGNTEGVGMKRFNLTSKTSYRPNKLLKLGLSLFANRRNNSNYVSDKYGLINPVYYSRIANPYQLTRNADGSYAYDYNVASGNTQDRKRGFNIFEERASTSLATTATAINALFDAELRLSKQWKISSQFGLQWEQSKQEEYLGQSSYTMRDLRESARTGLIPQGGRNKVLNRVLEQATWKGLIEYKNSFGKVHEVQLMAGSELRRNKYTNVTSTAWGYNPKTLSSITPIFRDENEARNYPLYNETLTRNAFASFFANGSYTLLGRYTLGASVRLDGSDLFGVDEKYRYLPIYSLSGLWRASSERFLADVKWLDNLAFRLSYGLQGNIDKNTSPYLVGTYSTASLLPGSTEELITIGSAPNSKLRWEKTATYNLGFDLAVLNNAISLSLDYYQRHGSDLIATRTLALENGFRSMTINWAEMNNKGLEINLQTRNIQTKDVSWTTTFNFAYNQNKVLRVMTPENQTTPSLEGYPVGAIFAIPTAGINPQNGQVLIDNGDGTSSTLEQKYKMVDEWGIGSYSIGLSASEQRKLYQYVGTSDAPYTGGLMNELRYKGWELSLNLAYYLGAHVRTSPSYTAKDFDPGRNVNRDILDRWTPSNTTATLPALITQSALPADYSLLESQPEVYRNLDIWVRPLSYFRLQNIRLGYSLPDTWLRGLGIKSANLALEGRNLFVLGSSHRNYLDPESMSNLYATPIPKSFTFHLSLTF